MIDHRDAVGVDREPGAGLGDVIGDPQVAALGGELGPRVATTSRVSAANPITSAPWAAVANPTTATPTGGAAPRRCAAAASAAPIAAARMVATDNRRLEELSA